MNSRLMKSTMSIRGMYHNNATVECPLRNGSFHSWNTVEENEDFILKIRNRNEIREIDISRNRSLTLHLHNLPLLLIFIFAITGFTGHMLKTWIPGACAVLLVSCLLTYLHFMLVSKETLTIISSFGVQISSEYFTGRRATQFLPFHMVQDIIIHEAVTMHKVVYYLAILLRHQENGKLSNSLVPVFLHSMPRLNVLRAVHKSVHEKVDFHRLHRNDMDASKVMTPNR